MNSSTQAENQDKFLGSCLNANKKALLVGVGKNDLIAEYFNKMEKILIKHFGFKHACICKLIKSDGIPPTSENILNGIQWLVDGASANDSLVFYFLGQGAREHDRSGDEWDGYDEGILPLDKENPIFDDELYDLLVRPLPLKCRLTAFFDSSHSGTVLDLAYEYDHQSRLVIPQTPFFGPPTQDGWIIGHGETLYNYNFNFNLEKKNLQKDVICFSSCRDPESYVGFQENGYMTEALCSLFANQVAHRSYSDILAHLDTTTTLKTINHKPAFSSAYEIDLGTFFSM